MLGPRVLKLDMKCWPERNHWTFQGHSFEGQGHCDLECKNVKVVITLVCLDLES